MASDQEIVEAIVSVLRLLNPNAGTTLNDVVLQLEAKLGHSLWHRIAFIRDHINFLLRPPQPLPPPINHHHHHLNHFAFPSQQQHRQRQPQQILDVSSPQFCQDLNFECPPVVQQCVPVVAQDVGFVQQGALRKQSNPSATKRKGGPGGLSKICGVTPELQAVVGQPALPRTEIVKQLWAYIKKNNLQDPSNKRKIICDDALRIVFETDSTDMFKMNKLLSKHIVPLEPSKESGQAKKLKVEVESIPEGINVHNSQFRLSAALIRFLGTEEKYMTQSEAIQRVWDYIKVNHLEDPTNPMAILCDSRLQGLIGCPSISALGVSEILKSHHLRKR